MIGWDLVNLLHAHAHTRTHMLTHAHSFINEQKEKQCLNTLYEIFLNFYLNPYYSHVSEFFKILVKVILAEVSVFKDYFYYKTKGLFSIVIVVVVVPNGSQCHPLISQFQLKKV